MTHDLGAVLEAIPGVAERQIAPGAASVDRDRAFPRASLDALAAVGALGLVVPVEYGGAGGSLSALAEACDTIGGACASSGMVFLMHSVTAATIAGGGGAQAPAALARLTSGDAIGTLAFSERGTGAHFYAPEIEGVRTDGGVRVSGRKSFVTSGGNADLYLVLVKGEAEGAADAYLLAADQPGVSFDGIWGGLGMAGNSSIALELDNVDIGVDALIGEPGGAIGLVFAAVAPFFLVGLAAVNVGIAAAAAAAATAHAMSRRLPGRLVARRDPVHPAPDRGHGHQGAHGPAPRA